MRLINVTSFILEEFFGDKVPEYEYAILSHTWDDEEVTFQDIIGSREAARNKKGFAKIQYLIDQARKDNIKWAWIDTCCIDKKSSAELSEAINSMWLWYSRSAVCYAYCADVPGGEDSAAMGSAFRKSRWFTRGWTLQELIAPYQVCFYSKDWTKIGMKMNSKYWSAEASLWRDGSTKTLPLLSEITGIPQEMLSGKKDKNEYSVAQRMSWASRRECTRQEDTAYCLLGIFDVNMPLLYGEEGGAFIRLQKEIMQNTDDHSIYAWTVPRWNPTIWAADSVLARSPAYFAKSGDVVPTKEEVDDLSIITKQGLRISLPLLKYEYPINHTLFARDKYCETFRATLNCRIGDKELQILLVKDSSTRSRWLRDHWYFRLGTLDHLFPEGDTTIPQNFFVRLEIPIKIWSAFRFPQSLRIHGLPVLLLPARASQDGGGPTDLMRMADNIGNYGLVDADLQARNWYQGSGIFEMS